MPANKMSDARDSLIAKQQLEIERLNQTIENLRVGHKKIVMKLIAVGGPLNDNFMQYNKEQLKIFWQIKDILDSVAMGIPVRKESK